MLVGSVLIVSLVLQLLAALLLVRLVRKTGEKTAWLLIAVAIVLMSVRRFTTLYEFAVLGNVQPSLITECIALLISIFLLLGIGAIHPYFNSLALANRRLEEQERKWNQTQTLGHIGHWSFDVASRQITWSDEVFRLFHRDKRLSVPGYEENMSYYAPADSAHLQDCVGRAIELGQQFELELNVLLPDGHAMAHHSFIVPVKNEAGTIVELEGTVQDITQRKKMMEEQRLLEKQVAAAKRIESIAMLTGGIAHDYNNILVGILGYATLLREQLPNESQQQDMLTEIIRAADRAAHLTQQMLAYSGQGQFEIRRVVLRNMIHGLRHRIEEWIPKGLHPEYEYGGGALSILADPGQVTQALQHLVINAAESIAHPNGRIGIRTGTGAYSREPFAGTPFEHSFGGGECAWLEVWDNGAGMSDETRANLFNPFFTTKFTGRGLGLAAVSGIMRGHGGAVLVESAPDKGASIRLLFPLGAVETTELGLDRESAAPEAAPVTILFVDDEPTIRFIAKRTLEKHGHRVYLASDGEEAIRVFESYQQEIALTILDVTMPFVSGLEAYNHIRAMNPRALIVLSSGYSHNTVYQRMPIAPEAPYLPKPYTPQELVRHVNRVLAPAGDSA
ncbi:MAG: response regulator [Candidatus Hydrogenedentes bacterium]|nr:response regulator [Candidatus Hydrogenedentota bacterium]